MVLGSLLIDVPILRGGADVMFTSYVPLRAVSYFYLGWILFAVGALIGVLNFFATLVVAAPSAPTRAPCTWPCCSSACSSMRRRGASDVNRARMSRWSHVSRFKEVSLREKARLNDPRIVTPTGKFNASNTTKDID